jgi:hypothetical protein
MKFLFLMTALLGVAGCVSVKNGGPVARPSGPNQVLVEAKIMDGGKRVAVPRVMTLNGQEARVEIGQAAGVPGREQPVPTGVTLVIQPRINGGRIVFRGSCQVTRPTVERDQSELRTAAFHTRAVYFAGVANSGEVKRVEISQPDGPPLSIELKFIVMVNTAGRVDGR